MTHSELVKRVRRCLKAKHMTPHALHRKLEGRVNRQTIYNFVKHGRVIRSDTLVLVLGEVGLTLSEKR